MAEIKRQIIQLYRNGSLIPGGYTTAVGALKNASDARDGEIVLARYKENDDADVKVALGVCTIVEGEQVFTPFMSSAEVEAAIAAQGTSASDALDALEQSLVGNAEVINNFEKVESAIAKILGETAVTEANVATIENNLKALDGRLDVIQSTSETQEGSIAKALKDAKDYADAKKTEAINAIDVKVDADANKFLTAFEIEDGKLKASQSATFASANGSVVVNGLDLSVNVDGETIVLDTAEGKVGQLKVASAALTQYVGSDAIAVGDVNASNEKTISLVISGDDKFLDISNVEGKKGLIAKVGLKKLTAAEVTALGEDNVKEAYKLIDKEGNAVADSDTIKIYKDSSVQDVHIGNPDNFVNGTEGEKESAQKLYLTYLKADGSTEKVAVDFSAFVAEAEAGTGLAVTDGVLNVVKANDSEDFLEVTADAIAVKGVQDAIDAAVDAAEYLTKVEAAKVGDKTQGIDVTAVDEESKAQTISLKVDTDQFGYDDNGKLIINTLDGGVF